MFIIVIFHCYCGLCDEKQRLQITVVWHEKQDNSKSNTFNINFYILLFNASAFLTSV